MSSLNYERRNITDHRERNLYFARAAFLCSKIDGFQWIPTAKCCGCSKLEQNKLGKSKKAQVPSSFFKKSFQKMSLHHLLSSSGAFLRPRCHQLLIIIFNVSSKSIKIKDRTTDLGCLCSVCTLHCAGGTEGYLVISIHGSLAAELEVRTPACQIDFDYI